jgi:hypothetical protein
VQQSCCDRAEDGYLLEIQASSLTAALLLLDIFLEILVITFVADDGCAHRPPAAVKMRVQITCAQVAEAAT